MMMMMMMILHNHITYVSEPGILVYCILLSANRLQHKSITCTNFIINSVSSFNFALVYTDFIPVFTSFISPFSITFYAAKCLRPCNFC